MKGFSPYDNLSTGIDKGFDFYSVCVSDFEKLDFKNDALAGVRANYFNSNHRPQADDTDISLDDVSYKLSYKMSKNQPLSWKVTKTSAHINL